MSNFPFRSMGECRVTCEYGRKGERWASGKHDGIDIVSDGDKTIISCVEGKVIRSGLNDSWGEYIVIQLNDGRALVHGHLAPGSRKVAVGKQVKVGDVLGIMGGSGHVSGPHLHIELQKKYYKAGAADDISVFLGIKNEVGKVTKR